MITHSTGLTRGSIRHRRNSYLTAFFAVLLFSELRDRVRVTAAALGAGIAFLLMPFTPAGIPVVAAACAALIGLKQVRRVTA